MTNQNRTTAAAELAMQLDAQTETARGLVLALERLTLAGQNLDTEARRHDLAANHDAAGAVLQALADHLDRMQAAADQLDELTAQICANQSSPAGSGADADDQSGKGGAAA